MNSEKRVRFNLDKNKTIRYLKSSSEQERENMIKFDIIKSIFQKTVENIINETFMATNDISYKNNISNIVMYSESKKIRSIRSFATKLPLIEGEVDLILSYLDLFKKWTYVDLLINFFHENYNVVDNSAIIELYRVKPKMTNSFKLNGFYFKLLVILLRIAYPPFNYNCKSSCSPLSESCSDFKIYLDQLIGSEFIDYLNDIFISAFGEKCALFS